VAEIYCPEAKGSDRDSKPFEAAHLHTEEGALRHSPDEVVPEWRCNMQHSNIAYIGCAALLGAGALLATGCGDVGEPGGDGATESADTVATASEAFGRPWRHHRPPAGTGGSGGTSATTGGTSATGGTGATSGGTSATGGTTSSGGSAPVDCSVCTVAQDCCNAVNAGALCTFSADVCSAYDPGRQKTYAIDCLVTLRTIITAWTGGGSTPPPVCVLPSGL
jgi:hypothetical protein